MKLTELEAAAAITPADLIYVVQGGVSKKGTTQQLGAGILGSTIVRKAADQSVFDSTTLVPDAELFLPVVPGTYRITIIANALVSPANTGGFKVALTAAASGAVASAVEIQVEIGDLSGGTARLGGRITALDTAISGPGGQQAYGAFMTGTVVITTGGTIGLLWAQSSTLGADTTTIKAGAYMELVRIS
jgi:hypothetical protein